MSSGETCYVSVWFGKNTRYRFAFFFLNAKAEITKMYGFRYGVVFLYRIHFEQDRAIYTMVLTTRTEWMKQKVNLSRNKRRVYYYKWDHIFGTYTGGDICVLDEKNPKGSATSRNVRTPCLPPTFSSIKLVYGTQTGFRSMNLESLTNRRRTQ